MSSLAGRLCRTFVWTVLVPGSVTVVVPLLILTHCPHQLWRPGPWRWLGLLPILAAVVLYLWSAWNFVALGAGTPNPLEPPRSLVARGPYAVSRNPMYVACFLAVGGEVWLTGSDWLARFFIGELVVVWLWVRWWEEPQMARRHADSYRAYCARVPRWLGLPRAKSAGSAA